MNVVTKDDVVRAVAAQSSAATPIVLSRHVKRWLDDANIEWGRPHGYRLKDAEADEVGAPSPRFVKFKCGTHQNSPMGFALRRFLAQAEALAGVHGWRRLP
jgi:hypothetical protein